MPGPGPVSRRPRLDVQSEDEEEALETASVVNQREEVEVESAPPLKISLERKSLLVASFLLLLLLVVIHGLVSSLQSEHSLHDSLILGLAYTLTPVRLVLETVRLILGPSPVHYSADSLDYDVLIENIVSSERFRLMVERVSSDKLTSLESDLQQKFRTEINSVSSADTAQKLDMDRIFQEELAQTRLDLSVMVENSISGIKQQFDLTGLENQQEAKARDSLLESQINLLKLKLEEITKKLENSRQKPDEQISAELGLLKDKLNALEKNREVTGAEVRKCCGENSKIDLVTSNKVEELMKQLKVTLEDKMISKTDFEARITETEAKADESLFFYKKKIVEETKQEIENLMSSKVYDLKTSLVAEAEVVTVSSTNVTESSSRSGLDVKKIVREALTKYDADKTGLFDFALETAGGSILSTKCTEPYQVTTGVMSVWGIPFWWETNSPRTILQPGTSPGQCWAFRGSQGSVLVQLSSAIHITAVSIEHISSLLSPDGNIYSAPSHMSLSGVTEDREDFSPLLNFTYSASGDTVQVCPALINEIFFIFFLFQTFWLTGPSVERWRLVELSVHNNHGHPDYTCLYRLRVHGNVSQDPDTVMEH